MASAWGYYLLVGVVVLGVLLKFGRDWRSYLTIAGALLSLVVARKNDINTLVPVPDSIYNVCLGVGILFLLVGFGFLVLDLFRRPQPELPQPQGPRPKGPRPEISYAFYRGAAAWSSHSRVPLVLRPPPDPRQPAALGFALLAGLRGDPFTVVGERIGALYSYEILLMNTGDQPFRNLPIQIDVFVTGYGACHEAIIEEPSVTAPPGARVEVEQRGAVTVVGTCDLFNPGERLKVRFYTRGEQFAEPEPQARAAARAENLPPLVHCAWPVRDGDRLRPTEPDYDVVPRGAIRFALGNWLHRLTTQVRILAGRIGYRRVVRGRNN